jgi:hypothetical protein
MSTWTDVLHGVWHWVLPPSPSIAAVVCQRLGRPNSFLQASKPASQPASQPAEQPGRSQPANQPPSEAGGKPTIACSRQNPQIKRISVQSCPLKCQKPCPKSAKVLTSIPGYSGDQNLPRAANVCVSRQADGLSSAFFHIIPIPPATLVHVSNLKCKDFLSSWTNGFLGGGVRMQ